MDMMGNNANTFDLSYKGGFGWGDAGGQRLLPPDPALHELPAGPNGGVNATPTTGMPMYVNGQDYGYSIKAEINAATTTSCASATNCTCRRSTNGGRRVGKGDMMMGPGHDVLQHLRQHQQRPAQCARNLCRMGAALDAAMVHAARLAQRHGLDEHRRRQGYNDIACTAWTTRPPSTRRTTPRPSSISTSRRCCATIPTRPPAMNSAIRARRARRASTNSIPGRPIRWPRTMIGWFGDGNGYVGNLNLKPETAHTIALTGQWSDPTQKVWNVKLTPYYSYVQDYIDVERA